MPIEIHCTSDIDDQGEERTRPKVTPHPLVRPQDYCYISKPEHLAAMLHLKVFRTTSHRPSHVLDPEIMPTSPTESPRADLFSLPQQKQTKKLLGREWIESQQTARQLALEVEKSPRRGAQATSATAGCSSTSAAKSAMEAKLKHQETHLKQVLEAIRCTHTERERLHVVEQVSSVTSSSAADTICFSSYFCVVSECTGNSWPNRASLRGERGFVSGPRLWRAADAAGDHRVGGE